jgi:hypothetical protein
MVHKSPLQKKKENDRRTGSLVFFGIAVLVVGLAFLLMTARQENPRIDQSGDLCREDGYVSAYWSVVIDTTGTDSTPTGNAFTELQKISIKNAVTEIAQDPEQLYAKLNLYLIDGNVSSGRTPKLSICQPLQTANPILAAQQIVENTWEEKFVNTLDDILDSIVRSSYAGQSPIMETIQNVSVSSFPSDTSTPRNLVIISDMIQNTIGNSHLDRVPEFDAFNGSSAYQKVRADLTGVNVIVRYLTNHQPSGLGIQKGSTHAIFWGEYFISLGATRPVDFSRLDG